MGGKGGGAKIPSEVEESARALLERGQEQFNLGLPLQQLGAEQGLDVLQGGVGGLRPAITSALAQGRRQGGESIRNLEESLVGAGITGTELQSQLADARQRVASEISQIPFGFTQPILQSAAREGFSLPQQGLQNIGAATQGAANAAFAERPSGGALGGLAGAAGGALSGFAVAGPIGAVAGGLLGGAKGAK